MKNTGATLTRALTGKIMEGEIPWQRESMVGQPQGHITAANSIGNAMFNGVEAIYGGRFVQNIVARKGKGSWIISKS
jgi:hypothetical protein